MDPRDRDQERDKDRGADGGYIGNRPELAEQTIPGGVRDDDERVAAYGSQSSGEGKASDREQDDDAAEPHGHRNG